VAICAQVFSATQPAWAQAPAADAESTSEIEAETEKVELEPDPAAEEAGSLTGTETGTGKGSKAIVQVSSSGDKVIVSKVTGRMVAAGGGVVVAGVRWQELCMSPCSLELDPGLHELMVYGDGISAATLKTDFAAGEHRVMADPGSSALQTGGTWLAAAGIVTGLMGVLFLFVGAETTEFDCETDPSCPERTVDSGTKKLALPLIIGGAAGTGVGIGMMLAGRTSLEHEPRASASATPNRAWSSAPLGLSYNGVY
jgi:hypothetical protein